MASSYLLSECLEKIFLNLLDENNTHISTSTKDLYTCTLVSRHWCRVSTPFLYAYPFHHFRNMHYSKIYLKSNATYSSYFKLIRTLLSCVPKSELEQIILSNSSNSHNLIDSNEEPPLSDILSTFNYISFIRGLIFDKLGTYKLFLYRETWLPFYILNNEYQFSRISIPILNHFVKYLCNHCNNLSTLEFSCTTEDNKYFNNIIESLTYRDCNGRSKLSGLKELYLVNTSMSPQKYPYLALSNNVGNLKLLYNESINSTKEADLLSQFISSQKNLQHIVLSERSTYNNFNEHYNIVFNSLSTQRESLQTLEFKCLPFNKINRKALNSLCLLKNIRELKLYLCRGINNNLNSWAKNLKLEVFECVVDYYTTISESFLIQLIQSSSNTLTKLVVKNDGRTAYQCNQLFQKVSLYLSSLIHLELPKLIPTELISIFKSCTQLVYLSTVLVYDGTLEENVKNLGKLIPKNLRKIQFKEMDYLVFSINELKCFFEECVNSNGKLKYLEIVGNGYVGQKYFNVAKEFGIELIISQPI